MGIIGATLIAARSTLRGRPPVHAKIHASNWDLGPLFHNFMGQAPVWYKIATLTCLVLNPLIYAVYGPFVVGWVILIQFIATLALALKCWPLLPGGLLLLEALALGLVSPETIHKEEAHNLPILFLVLFVVTGVYFLKELLGMVFMHAILRLRSERALGLFFLCTPAFLSALLDAMTVTAVVVIVMLTILEVVHAYASQAGEHGQWDHTETEHLKKVLRRLATLTLVGTMLGGITTLIGEPQNLLIGAVMGWHFVEFFIKMLPVSVPVVVTGILTALLVEKFRYLDYGTPFTPLARKIITDKLAHDTLHRTPAQLWRLRSQAFCAIVLVVALVLHVAEVYIIGLMLLILATTLNGSTEHDVGEGLKEGASFVFVLALFFGIVGMIHDQHLFAPVNEWILSFEGNDRLLAYYSATGGLSAGSDNVFVASLFISGAQELYNAGIISREEFENIAVAINMGTNVPSIGTPNGQAAFLFMLMSPLAPRIGLSYMRLLLLALPFTITCTAAGAAAIYFFY
jgi:NhaB family Na+:H+ antiporter